ncbi:TetR/AcrR family transcriptional regulator [Pseudoalteromonas denitrificans]|uniref:Transcriptional regulator, TetR family n=1 Tax=Pseudoalteromonas denitrificans DSM 6059 TaxID=1123010 RepID=A0A1I1NW62_9GAMM|nr:TetR/AcrR family transcriptional regulator [Pseudoalteromonas denitrificans]SFC98973.1 transcriptional regulator, TetR family [Pseudoalteromonas denitrificans DSM 6059]
MTPRILDEQALQAREQDIINAAVVLIQEQGVEHLTMDKVVGKVSYSKGTVYKHFDGKEDLLLAISNYAVSILSDLFWRASQFQGCTRERMLLLNFSYLIYAILHPALFQTVVCAKSPNVSGKSSEKRLQEQEQLEFKLLGAIHGIVEGALTDKSLNIPEHMDIQQLCFANWSMAYGTIILLSGEVEQCSGRTALIVERELFNQNNLLFDGMKWQPLTHEKDYASALKKALEQVFPKELLLMHEKGRDLNF